MDKKLIWFFLVTCYLLLATCSYAMSIAPPADNAPIEDIRIKLVTKFGTPGSAPGQFFSPSDVFVPSIGDRETEIRDLFITDTQNSRVQRFDQQGDYKYQFGEFGTDNGKFNQPLGIVIDFNYQVYVVDSQNSRVQKFDIRGVPLLSFGSFGKEKGQFMDPSGIALDRWGKIYVADTGNDRIQKFNEDGTFVEAFGGFGYGDGFFNRPKDVAVDKDRNIYVLDSGNSRVQVLDEFGKMKFYFGSFGKTPGQFSQPSGIALNDKYIVVSDTGNYRIQVFNKNGQMLRSANTFYSAAGVAIDDKNFIYVVDRQKKQISIYQIISMETQESEK